MNNIKNQITEEVQVKKCSKCGLEYELVQLGPRNSISRPKCVCDELNIKINREMLIKLMKLASNGINAISQYSRLLKLKIPDEQDYDYSLDWTTYAYISKIIERQTGLDHSYYTIWKEGLDSINHLIYEETRSYKGKDMKHFLKAKIKIKNLKIKLPWKVIERKSFNKECRFCGKKYLERTMYFGKFPFTYSIKPECLCECSYKLKIWKWQIPYLVGGIRYGAFVVSMFNSLINSWADNPVFLKSDYYVKMKKIIKMIKEQTGINEEIPKFHFFPDQIYFIKQAVEEECRRAKKQWERIEKLHVEDMKEMEKNDSKKKVTNLQIVRDIKNRNEK